MSKSMASLMCGISSMRERAATAQQHSNYTVLQNRMVEELYPVKISELVGKSFRPLVGFTVTVEEVLPFAQARERKVDDVVSFSYVEYGTGYRLKAYLTVELDADYLPLGVELKAFRDAVVVQCEQLLNACGYTFNESPIMGLRNVNGVDHTHDTRFVEMFDGDKTLKKATSHPLNDQVAVTFEETEHDYRFTTPISALLHTTKAGTEGLIVHVDALGDLAQLATRRIFVKAETKVDENDKLVTTRTFAIDVEPDKMRAERHVDFHKLTNPSLGTFALETKIEGNALVQIQPKDWKGRELSYALVIDRPEDWRFISVRSPSWDWSGVTAHNDEFTKELIAQLNLQLPVLLRAPRAKQVAEAEDVQPPRRTFRKWLSDLFLSWANKLD